MTKIYQPPYVYTLNFSEEIITNIREEYFKKYNYLQRSIEERCFAYCDNNLVDIVRNSVPGLSSHLTNTGLVMVLDPGVKTNIHIDQRKDTISTRNVAINFPIKMTKSVTAFYRKADIVFSHNIEQVYSVGHYYAESTPILDFEMENQAVLFNTSVFHRVSNLSDSETRVILSVSFNADYTFDQSLEILKEFGYAN